MMGIKRVKTDGNPSLLVFALCLFLPLQTYSESDVGVTPGEFEVSLQGSANYTIPIKHTPGTGGITPQLSLVYSSQTGPSPIGMGWNLAGMSLITRGPKNKEDDGVIQGVTFSDKDAFYLDGQRLIPISELTDGFIEYKTLVDNYSRIISYHDGNLKLTHFKVWTKAGLIMDYGNSNNSNIKLASGETLIWANSRITDSVSNYMNFEYLIGSKGSYVLKQVNYTGNLKTKLSPYATITFNYCQLATDCVFDGGANKVIAPIEFIHGNAIQQEYMLTSIESKFEDQLFRKYKLNQNTTNRHSRFVMNSIQEFGPNNSSFPATQFNYTTTNPSWVEKQNYELKINASISGPDRSSMKGFKVADINNDGLLDILQAEHVGKDVVAALIATAEGDYVQDNAFNSPVLFSDLSKHKNVMLIDYNDDSRPDLIWSHVTLNGTIEAGAFKNTTSGWIQDESRAPPLAISNESSVNLGTLAIDINEDGHLDFLVNNSEKQIAYLWDHSTNSYEVSSAFTPPFRTDNDWIFPIQKDKELIGILTKELIETTGKVETKIYQIESDQWTTLDENLTPNFDTNIPAESIHIIDLTDDDFPEIFISFESDDVEINKVFQFDINGWTSNAVLSDFPKFLFTSDGPLFPIFADINEDGRKDVLVYHEGQSKKEHFSYLNTSAGWVSQPKKELISSVSSWDNGRNAAFVGKTNNNESLSQINLAGQGEDFAPFSLYVYNTENEKWEQKDEPLEPPVEIAKRDKEDQGVRFVDLDADGLTDVIFSIQLKNNSKNEGAFRNTGDGWIEFDGYKDVPYPITSEEYGDNGIELIDVNGDTKVDFVYSIKNKSGNLEAYGVYLNTGSGWDKDESYSEVIKSHPLVDYKHGSRGVRFVDLNGDGLMDFLYSLHHDDQTIKAAAMINKEGTWQRDDNYLSPVNFTALTLHKYFVGIQSRESGPNDTSIPIYGNNNMDYYFYRDYNPIVADINRDSLPDLVFNHQNTHKKYKNLTCVDWEDVVEPGTKQQNTQTTDEEPPEPPQRCTKKSWITLESDSSPVAYINTGFGWSEPQSEFNFPRRLDGRVDDTNEYVLMQDVNGDQLLDVIFAHKNKTSSATFINTGKGWNNDNKDWIIPPKAIGSIGDQLGLISIDVNADGLLDIVYNQCTNLEHKQLYQEQKEPDGYERNPDGSFKLDEFGNKIQAYRDTKPLVGTIENGCQKTEKGTYLNTGAGFRESTIDFSPPLNIVSVQRGDLGVRFLDVTGNGIPDSIQNYSNTLKTNFTKYSTYREGMGKVVDAQGNEIDVSGIKDHRKSAWINQSKRVDILNQITNGAGLGVEIEYAPLGFGIRQDDCEFNNERVYCSGPKSDYPIIDAIPTIYAVKKTTAIDPTQDPLYQRTNEENYFQYGDFRMNVKSGDVLGFAWRKTSNNLNSQKVLNVIEQERHLTGLAKRNITYKGRKRVADLNIDCHQHQAKNDVLVCSDNNWQKTSFTTDNGMNHFQVNLIENKIIKNDLTGLFLSSEQELISYDSFGNALKTVSKLSDGSQVETTNNYQNITNQWFLGRLMDSTVTRSNQLKGLDPEKVKVCFDYDTESGLINSERQYCELDPYEVKSDFTYDDYGNLIKTRVSAPYEPSTQARITENNFDEQGRFAISTTNTLGHTVQNEYHPVFGIIIKTIDPNKLETTHALNDHGDVIASRSPDGIVSTVRAEILPTNNRDALYKIVKEKSSSKQSLPPVETWFNRRGYVVRQSHIGFKGQKIYSDVVYDDFNRKISTSRPYQQGETIQWAFIQYDELDRPIKTTAPDQSQTYFTYIGFDTKIKDALGRTTQSTSDISGNVISVVDALESELTHQYDVSGRLVKTTNIDGTEITHKYDITGNKISTNDPDLGLWLYQYDAFGQLLKQTDAKGQKTELEYDVLGRMIQKNEFHPASESGQFSLGNQANWIYDQYDKKNQRTNLGLLSEVRGADGYTEHYLYDEFRRVIQTTTNDQLVSFTSSVEFDDLGRTHKQVYPSGFTVENIYNQYGYFTEVIDHRTKKSFWKANQMDSHGNITKESYGNHLQTQYDFHPETNFVMSIHTEDRQKKTIHGFRYQYDALGNVLKRENLFTSEKKKFNYDELDRLTNTIINHFEIENSYEFDLNGNFLNKSDLGRYFYDSDDGPAHGVVKVVTHKGKELTYEYDANGNMSRNQNKHLYYDIANRVTHIKADRNTWSRFKYTPSGAKYYQEYSDGLKRVRTHYIGAYEKIHEVMVPPYLPSSEHIRLRHYIMGANGVVAIHENVEYLFPIAHTRSYERQTSNKKPERTSHHVTQTRYLHKDNLGSLTLITDDAGQEFERMAFDAWGKRIKDPLKKSNYHIYKTGYTGHEQLDHVGLIHMGGRVYDPNIARFVSADPVMQSPNNLQNLNRYTYVLNNPFAYTDPSGFFFKKLFRNIFGKHGLGGLLKKTFKEFGRFMKKYGRQIVIVTVAVVVFVVTKGGSAKLSAAMIAGAASGAAAGALTAAMYGGNILESAAKGALFGAATAGLGHYGQSVGQGFGMAGANVGRAVGSGIGSGLSAKASGGHFEKGMVSGFASSYIGGTSYVRSSGIIGVALAGGTASVIGGGKFANGAVLAAVAYLATHASIKGVKGVGGTRGGKNLARSADGTLERSSEVEGDFVRGRNKISSKYGVTRTINGKENLHAGVDIVPLNSDGSVNRAAVAISGTEGTFFSQGVSKTFGNYVLVRTNQGNYVFYAHLSSHAPNIPQQINVGTELGIVGNTGYGDGGIHLHVEIRKGHWEKHTPRLSPGMKYE